MGKKVRLTKKVVDSLTEGEMVRDNVVVGLAVRCRKTQMVYVLRTSINGRERWLTIGMHGSPYTVETAREEALRLWGQIKSGKDLGTLRDARKSRPTVRELGERFLKEYSAEHNKPLTYEAYERNYWNHIDPLLGKERVADISRADIENLQRKVKEGKTAKTKLRLKRKGTGGRYVLGGAGAANRVLALMSKMMNVAEDWKWRPENSNPVKRVIRYKETKKERYLSSEELKQLGTCLREMHHSGELSDYSAAGIRLLIFTGARLQEILTLKWSYVDLERRLLLLPDSKTGKKAVVLNQAAVDVLQSLPRREKSPWVLPGQIEGQPLKSLQGVWVDLRRRAGIADVRLHDLRHSFASFAALEGGSLPVIGNLLGHLSPATTARYVHLTHSPASDLSERVSTKVAAAMGETVRRTGPRARR